MRPWGGYGGGRRLRARVSSRSSRPRADYAFDGEEWALLERDARAIAQGLKSVDRPDEMEAGVLSLEQRQRKGREHLETLLKDVKKNPLGSENAPHQYTYNPNPYPQEDTVITSETSSETGGGAGSSILSTGAAGNARKGKVHGIRPDELVRLAPTVEALSAPAEPDLAGDHRRRRLAAARSRCVETTVERCLPDHGAGPGGGRAGGRLN